MNLESFIQKWNDTYKDSDHIDLDSFEENQYGYELSLYPLMIQITNGVIAAYWYEGAIYEVFDPKSLKKATDKTIQQLQEVSQILEDLK